MNARLASALTGMGLGLALSSPASASEPDADDSLINKRDSTVAVRLKLEGGLLVTAQNRLQLGADGTYADFRSDYGQDTLFPYWRVEGDLDIGKKRRHTAVLLYQPLDLRSETLAPRELTIESQTIEAGTPIETRYGFSFWRGAYLYDLLKDERELGLGAGLQIRNANLQVYSQDGAQGISVRDVGPVPLLYLRGRGTVRGRFWMGGEVAGFYAPIRYINGSGTDVEGAIIDASLRVGMDLRRGTDAYFNLRWIGGGAQGTGKNPEPFTDGFTRNWLHFVAASVGVSFR